MTTAITPYQDATSTIGLMRQHLANVSELERIKAKYGDLEQALRIAGRKS